MSYPDYENPKLLEDLSVRKELYQYATISSAKHDYYHKFSLRRLEEENIHLDLRGYQEVSQIIMDPKTPYKIILKLWAPGKGKTIDSLCSAMLFTDLIKINNKGSIFCLGFTRDIFKKELLSHTEYGFVNNDELRQLKLLDKNRSSSNQNDIDKYEEYRNRLVKRLSNRDEHGYFVFIGYRELVNKLFETSNSKINISDMNEDEIRAALKDGSLKINKDVLESFDDSYIICDEFHETYNSNEKNNWGIAIQLILEKAKNYKAALLTATPLGNSPTEIVDLANTVDPGNNYKREQFFDSDSKLLPMALKHLEAIFKGRVSVVNGVDSVYFPRQEFIGESIPKIDYLKFTRCNMSEFQYQTYIDNYEGTLSQDSQYLVDFALPTPLNTKGIYKTNDIKQQLSQVDEKWYSKNGIQYSNTIITGWALQKEYLKKLSNKYYKMLEYIDQYMTPDGGKIALMHPIVHMSGVLFIEQVLLQNGFIGVEQAENDNTRCSICGIIKSKHTPKKGGNSDTKNIINTEIMRSQLFHNIRNWLYKSNPNVTRHQLDMMLTRYIFNKVDYIDKDDDPVLIYKYVESARKCLKEDILYLGLEIEHDDIDVQLKQAAFMLKNTQIENDSLAELHDNIIVYNKVQYPDINNLGIKNLSKALALQIRYKYLNLTTLGLARDYKSMNLKPKDGLEAYASAFNHYFDKFCSAFPDLEDVFGSLGPFLKLDLLVEKPKKIFINPPFDNTIMMAALEKVRDYPGLLYFTVPYWEDAPIVIELKKIAKFQIFKKGSIDFIDYMDSGRKISPCDILDATLKNIKGGAVKSYILAPLEDKDASKFMLDQYIDYDPEFDLLGAFDGTELVGFVEIEKIIPCDPNSENYIHRLEGSKDVKNFIIEYMKDNIKGPISTLDINQSWLDWEFTEYNTQDPNIKKYIWEQPIKGGAEIHDFMPARYIIVHSDMEKNVMQRNLDKYNESDNLWGHKYKILVGSKIFKQSHNTNCVQHVAILGRPDNISTLLQMFGRFARNKSHLQLPEEYRQVDFTIFVSTLLNTKTLSHEEKKYLEKVSDYKEIQLIERMLNQCAIDGFVMYNTNSIGLDSKNDKLGPLYYKPLVMPRTYSLKELNKTTFDVFYSDREVKTLIYLIKRYYIEISNVFTFDQLWECVKDNIFGLEMDTTLFQQENFVIALTYLVYNSKTVNMTSGDSILDMLYNTVDKRIRMGDGQVGYIHHIDIHYVFIPFYNNENMLFVEYPFRTCKYIKNKPINVSKYLKDSSQNVNYESRKLKFKEKYMNVPIEKLATTVNKFGSQFHQQFAEEIITYIFDFWTNPAITKKSEMHDFYFKILYYYDILQLIAWGTDIKEFLIADYKNYILNIKNQKIHILSSSHSSSTNTDTLVKETKDVYYKTLKLSESILQTRSSGPKQSNAKLVKVEASVLPVGHFMTKIPRFYTIEKGWFDCPEYIQSVYDFKENDVIIGYYEKSSTGLRIKFKIRKPLHQITKHSDTRMVETGSMCSSNNKQYLTDIAKRLKIPYDKDHNIPNLCEAIEARLIQNELEEREKKTNVKWFYTFWETRPDEKHISSSVSSS